MYVAKPNTAILNIRIFRRRYTSDYGFLLRLVNTFTIDTDEYYPMCYKVSGCQASTPIKNFVYTLCAKSSYVGLYILHSGSFNWGL